MTAPFSPARPRFWRLQFSLRLALVAFTAFAIGFPLWYRWPYEEREVLSAPGAPSKETRVTTWQRQWGGGRLKHGREQLILGDNEPIESTTYILGRKHGPFFGEGVVTGQYVDDMKEGVWVYFNGQRTMTWHHDRLDGPAEIEIRIKIGKQEVRYPKIQLLFASGRLTHFNGKPATNRLFDLMETDKIAPPIGPELLNFTEMSFVQVPLKDVVTYLMDKHGIPIQIDPKVPDPDLAITIDEKGLDLCSALTLLTAPHGLCCDYRYGCIWITTAADAKDWHDPTGVMEIKPPKGGALARAWNESISPAVAKTRLSVVLNGLSQGMGVEMELAAPSGGDSEAADPWVNLDGKFTSFRDVIGVVLYRTGYRCKLEGDKLVILPPKAAAP